MNRNDGKEMAEKHADKFLNEVDSVAKMKLVKDEQFAVLASCYEEVRLLDFWGDDSDELTEDYQAIQSALEAALWTRSYEVLNQ